LTDWNDLMNITGKTRIAGIFGYPVGHTLSPAMQNAAFSHCGLDYCYLPFSVAPEGLGRAIDAIRALGLCGVNLTVPHKETAIPFLDRMDEEAAAIGAVNTVTNNDNVLIGYNTDGKGFVMSLKERGVSLEDSRALIIGAGGASRAVGYYLSKTAKTLHLYNRTREKAVALASHLTGQKGKAEVTESLSSVAAYDIIINSTSLGLKANDPLPLDADLLNPSQVVCDLIYRKTPLLQKAAEKGCTTIDGLGMLLWQGAYAFELWTGVTAPVEVMRTALLSVAH
jgi:shikimate dehydrogenase